MVINIHVSPRLNRLPPPPVGETHKPENPKAQQRAQKRSLSHRRARVHINMGKIQHTKKRAICTFPYAVFLAHWNASYNTYGSAMKGSKATTIEHTPGQVLVFITCNICKVKKQALPEHYRPGNVKGNIHEWLKRGKHGLPNYRNTCRMCVAKKDTDAVRVPDSSLFWQKAAYAYKSIYWKDAMAKFAHTLYGFVTGLPKCHMLARSDHMLTIGFHDLEREHVANGTKHDTTKHMLETCEFDLAIFNVRQGKKIPDLRAAWIAMYLVTICVLVSPDAVVTITNDIEAMWGMTPMQVGVTASRTHENAEYEKQCRRLHPRYALGSMARIHRNVDRRANRVEGDATAEGYMDVARVHDWRCAVCMSPLTLCDDTWRDISFDRIDNHRGHDNDNVRPVCRLHQAVVQNLDHVVTRAMHLHMTMETVYLRDVRTDKHMAVLRREHDTLVREGQECALCNPTDAPIAACAKTE